MKKDLNMQEAEVLFRLCESSLEIERSMVNCDVNEDLK